MTSRVDALVYKEGTLNRITASVFSTVWLVLTQTVGGDASLLGLLREECHHENLNNGDIRLTEPKAFPEQSNANKRTRKQSYREKVAQPASSNN